jgi:hypothetical protein
MKNSPFSDIKKKNKALNTISFIEDAKVDGSKVILDKNERRGSSYLDTKTGKRVSLSGKIIQVPVNGYELEIMTLLAKEAGLPIGTYLRNLVMDLYMKN